jgi:hypothetical protein
MRPPETSGANWVRAGKAYISSLGTTGLLIASSLLLLAVVGTVLAFDRWPDNAAAADTQVVPIAGAAVRGAGSDAPRGQAARATAARAAGDTTVRAATSGAAPRATAGVAAVQVVRESDSLTAARPADPVVSDLPAPDSAPTAGAAPAPAQAATAPTPEEPVPEPEPPQLPLPGGDVLPLPSDAGGGLSGVTQPLADSLGQVSPALGHTVQYTGATVDGLVQTKAR